MKQQIDNLIANTLLDGEEVYLPNIGTLILYRHPAKRLSSKKLQQPYHELRITSEERGMNILTLISKVASVDEERASDIYTEWLTQSQRNGVTTIDTVCSIENGVVSTIESFEIMANPKGRGVTKINPRTNYFIYILSGLCIGFALGTAGFILYSNGTFDDLLGKTDATTKVAEVAPTEPTTTEPTVEVVAESAEVATEPSSEVSTGAPTTEASTGATNTTTKVAEPEIPALQKGKSYAVWGVYTKLESAEKYIKWLADNYPEIEAKTYLYDSRYMVALCEVSSRNACGNKVSAWKKQSKSFKDVWVYTR